MYKIIFDNIDSTFNQIYLNDDFFNILNQQSFIIQSFKQNRGVGRGNKNWESPHGNFYVTLNQKIKSKDVLNKSFKLCFLIHKYFKKKYSIILQYKWPNDLFFNHKKLVGVVSKSKIISQNAYTQIGIGININTSPLPISISLANILSNKISVYDFSNDFFKSTRNDLNKSISNKKMVNYLNKFLLSKFKLKHPHFKSNRIKVIKVENDLSLLINVNNINKKIFFGELS